MMNHDAMARGRVVRRGIGEKGVISVSGIEGAGRAVQPPLLPPDRRWGDLEGLVRANWLEPPGEVP